MATGRLEQLEAIEAAIWSELARAPEDKGHPWRVAVLATTDGRAGDARSVVLRDVDPLERQLVFYADSRSATAEHNARHPDGTLVMWSAPLSWQLRLRVHLSLVSSGLAVSSRWARLKMKPGAQDYLSPLPPGTEVEHPHPERGSREHFGVVTAQVLSVDWLELHAQGHRRARFDAAGRTWLVP